MQFLKQAAFVQTTDNRLIVLGFPTGPIRDKAQLELQRVIRFPDEVDAFIKTADTHYTVEALRKIRAQLADMAQNPEKAAAGVMYVAGMVDGLRAELGVPMREIVDGLQTPAAEADPDKKGA